MSRTEQTLAAEWGLRCPACGRDDSLEIELRVWAALSADGTELIDDHHDWDQQSSCRCTACSFTARVRDFSIDHQAKQL